MTPLGRYELYTLPEGRRQNERRRVRGSEQGGADGGGGVGGTRGRAANERQKRNLAGERNIYTAAISQGQEVEQRQRRAER